MKTILELKKARYALPVSFSHCKTAKEKEDYCITLGSDNAVFLNSALALLASLDKPFKSEEDYQNFWDFMDSTRPQLADRQKTLRFIQDNRAQWFAEGTAGPKAQGVISVFQYLLKNPILLEKTTLMLSKNVDTNYAVTEALENPSFSMHDEQNPVRKAWDALASETGKALKKQSTLSK